MAYSAQARTNMITNQLEPSGVNSERLLQAIEDIPRELFVPDALQESSYLDEDIPLGNTNRYLLEPRVFGLLMQAANVKPKTRVLDVACGSGYSSAVLSKLSDSVVAVESVGELAEVARRNLHQLHCSVELFNASVIGGYSLKAPYDIIFINGAISYVPEELVEQLAEGGKVIAVLLENPQSGMGVATSWTRIGKNIHAETLFDAAAPLINDFIQKKKFEF